MSAYTIGSLFVSHPGPMLDATRKVVALTPVGNRFRTDLVLEAIVRELDRRKLFALAADVSLLILDTPNRKRWQGTGGYYDAKGDWHSFLFDLATAGCFASKQQRMIEGAREAAAYVGD